MAAKHCRYVGRSWRQSHSCRSAACMAETEALLPGFAGICVCICGCVCGCVCGRVRQKARQQRWHENTQRVRRSRKNGVGPLSGCPRRVEQPAHIMGQSASVFCACESELESEFGLIVRLQKEAVYAVLPHCGRPL